MKIMSVCARADGGCFVGGLLGFMDPFRAEMLRAVCLKDGHGLKKRQDHYSTSRLNCRPRPWRMLESILLYPVVLFKVIM